MPCRIRIDDEGAVHAFVDVPLQRQGMAVIEVAAHRQRIELVDKLVTGLDHPSARYAVHARRVDAMKVDAVRVRAVVLEANAHPLALGNPERWARHPTVIRPGREEEAWRDLDLLVFGDKRELAQHPAVVSLP